MTGWPTAPDSYDDPMTAPARGEPVRLDPPGPEPTDLGRFGEFGGRYVPETLVLACVELDQAFRDAWSDPDFRAEAQDGEVAGEVQVAGVGGVIAAGLGEQEDRW